MFDLSSLWTLVIICVEWWKPCHATLWNSNFWTASANCRHPIGTGCENSLCCLHGKTWFRGKNIHAVFFTTSINDFSVIVHPDFYSLIVPEWFSVRSLPLKQLILNLIIYFLIICTIWIGAELSLSLPWQGPSQDTKQDNLMWFVNTLCPQGLADSQAGQWGQLFPTISKYLFIGKGVILCSISDRVYEATCGSFIKFAFLH